MKTAIFTIVRNERYFLPIWLKYYSGIVDRKDIYVIDNDTTDGSTNNLPCNVTKKHSDLSHNAEWMLQTVKKYQSDLLQKYDYVIFTEVDEIIINRQNNLIEYISQSNKDIIRCTGYEIKHYFIMEPAIDHENPLLEQRKYWYSNTRLCKPLISRVPLSWGVGFHTCKKMPEPDGDVFLIHLHKLDFDTALRRNIERMNSDIDSRSKDKRLGWQNFITDEDGMKDFWDKGHPGTGKLENIPDWIKHGHI